MDWKNPGALERAGVLRIQLVETDCGGPAVDGTGFSWPCISAGDGVGVGPGVGAGFGGLMSV